jgi:hypothetical protein
MSRVPRLTGFSGARRNARVAQLYLQRKRQVEISEEMGISQPRVSRIICEIQAEWRASAMRDWDTLKSEELARIDHVEAEAWKAWDRSCQEYTEETTETGERPVRMVDEAGKFTISSMAFARARMKREKRIGDPRFLQIVNQCIERRCDLLGLDAPKVIDIELRIREAARIEGLDEEAAVEEARRLLKSYTVA